MRGNIYHYPESDIICQPTAANELPETSIWHGAISDEDVQLVRRRHAEKVEEWLDFADFATELFKLHEKYGIEKGEEGYFAYRKHLRTNYYQKLETYGPTPDPLDEGCDCIFCRMHPVEMPTETETGKDRCADQPENDVHREPGSNSDPHATVAPDSQVEPNPEQVPAEPPADLANHNEHQRTEKKRRVHCVNQSADHNQRKLGPHSRPDITTALDSQIERGSEKRKLAPTSAPTWINKTSLKKMSGTVF